MHRLRALIPAVLACALVALASVAPASAKVVERGEFHEVFTGEIDDFCDVPGFTVAFEAVIDGRFAVKSHGPDGLLFFAEHVSVSQTNTNVANGLSVVEKTRILSKDLRVTDNGDGTLTIVLLETGPSSLYGPDGKAIARNPGQVRFQAVVDHGGTPTDPSDDVELSFTPIKGSTGRSDDYCEAIIDTIL
ncbi:MAG: hypothetical protein ACRDQ2_19550 [Gaiellales bacterium]